MITGKLAALCLCPALVATPAVIATHPKVRHAVAHIIHRAADQIDTPRAVRNAAAPILCPPAYASAGPGIGSGLSSPVATGVSVAPQELSALPLSAAASSPDSASTSSPLSGPGFIASPIGSGPASFPGSGVSGIGYLPTPIVPAPALVPGPGGIATSTPTPVAGVTEPQNWALLVTGFGATGLLLRSKRLKRA